VFIPYTYEDDFTSDTLSSYTWTYTSASSSYDATNDWIEIRTGDNYNATAEWDINNIPEGHAEIIYTKHADYPTDNNTYLALMEDADNCYYFDFRGSGYGTNRVRKFIGGSEVDSDTGPTSTDSNSEHTFKMWWSPTRLTFVHNGTIETDLLTSDTTQLDVSSAKLRVSQSDIDWKLIYITEDQPPI